MRSNYHHKEKYIISSLTAFCIDIFYILYSITSKQMHIFWLVYFQCLHMPQHMTYILRCSLCQLVLSSVYLHVFRCTACSRKCILTMVTFVRLFPTVCFQMSPQIACLRGCIITLVTFVQLFSTVRLQMCIITLVAFVQLLCTMFLQMCPQMACPRE